MIHLSRCPGKLDHYTPPLFVGALRADALPPSPDKGRGGEGLDAR